MSVRPWRAEIRFNKSVNMGSGNLGAGNLGSRPEYLMVGLRFS